MSAAPTIFDGPPESWSDQHVVVIGAGRSGVAAAHLLVDRGARVTITDLRGVEELPEIDGLRQRGVEVACGAHPDEIWQANGVAVISPGVPPAAPPVEKAREAGLRLVAEIELAAAFIRAPIIAITGSNGKSTATSMIGAIFEAAGKPAAVCGNIGLALSAAVRHQVVDGAAYTAYVVEVSSFQTEAIVTFHPQIAAILNITPDHLDRHGSMDRYAAAKMRLLTKMGPDDWLIYNHDDPELRDRLPDGPMQLMPFAYRPEEPASPAAWVGNERIWWWPADGDRVPVMPLAKLGVIGPHNEANACAAAAAARLAGIDLPSIAAGLEAYRALEHRMESIGEVGGVRCINDSKATNVGAAAAALAGFAGGVWLILGGRDKGADFGQLRPLLPGRVERILLIGEAADAIAKALAGADNGSAETGLPEPVMERCETLDRAVERGLTAAAAGDTLLLSPACTSFDQYTDFEERGRHFKRLVRERLRDRGADLTDSVEA